uniref:Tigger transposable element-derived protein 4 n=1 Tax=Timema genevievae TaxID=629358 RepID=A0A7R9PL64_TIMGE|nr:unnamed protein product [Timema genevievae]
MSLSKPQFCKSLTLAEKVAMIKEVEKGLKKKSEIAKAFGITPNTLLTFLKNKQKMLSNENESGQDRKRLRVSENPYVDNCVLKWFKQARDKKVPVNCPLLRAKAEHFASELGKTNFKASAGWLDGFKQRNRISFKAVCGETSRICKQVWDQVKVQTIKNCFKKAGFIKKENDGETVTETAPAIDNWEEVTPDPAISYVDFVSVDEDVAVCGEVTDADIVAEVLNNNIQAEDGASGEEEDNSSVVQERPIPSVAEAMDHIQ